MILLVNNAARRVPLEARHLVGDFKSPRAWLRCSTTPLWAADNDAFSGFNETRYERMLDSFATAEVPPRFVTLPDVVGNYGETVKLWGRWHRNLAGRNLNRAFVMQNGGEPFGHAGIPWDYIEALFIGGDTAFKFSGYVAEMVRYAKLHGKWVHMGRVNSVRRMEYARRIGCDSCDGSGMARFPTSVLFPMINALQQDQLFLL